jgi:uncharacterized protein YndB with AHSA1/START domain
MITFKQTGFINAPVEKVFAIIADPQQITQWRNDVPAISQISGDTKVGTTFIEEVHFMGKKQLLMKVTEYIPNNKIVIQAQSGMSLLPTQSFTFTGEGNKTRIDLNVSMKVSGLFVLMQFMLPAQLKKIWAKYFDNLNQLLSK